MHTNFQWQPDSIPVRGIGIAGGCGILIVFAVVLLGRRRRDPEKALVREFVLRMKKRGYVKEEAEGLDEFAAGIEDEKLREQACRFVEDFQGFFYRDRPISKDDKSRLRSIIEGL